MFKRTILILFVLFFGLIATGQGKSLTKTFSGYNPYWERILGQQKLKELSQRYAQQYGSFQSSQTFTVSSYQEYKLTLFKALRQRITPIEIIFEPAISSTTYQKWNSDFWNKDCNDIAWLGYAWTYYSGIHYFDYSGKVTKAEINLTYGYSRTQEEQLEQDLLETMRNLISPQMDTITREKTIHDWIVEHVTYSMDTLDGTYDLGYTDYSAFEYGRAVCQGYALLANRMFYLAGVDNLFVSGDAGGPHAWNMVYLFDSWYHVDTTWDDPVGAGPDYIRYDYYNLSDSEMAIDHSWDRTLYPPAPNVYDPNRYQGQIANACSMFHPEKCRTELDCLKIAGTWTNDQCTLPGIQPLPSQCDATHLNLCPTEDSCTNAGGYWYENACHQNPSELQVQNGMPNSALPEYSFNLLDDSDEVQRPQISISVSPGQVYIHPQLVVHNCNDVLSPMLMACISTNCYSFMPPIITYSCVNNKLTLGFNTPLSLTSPLDAVIYYGYYDQNFTYFYYNTYRLKVE